MTSAERPGVAGCGSPSGDGHDIADCEETIHRLYYYLDGELTDERRRARRASSASAPSARAR